jgi:hypothetical protein
MIRNHMQRWGWNVHQRTQANETSENQNDTVSDVGGFASERKEISFDMDENENDENRILLAGSFRGDNDYTKEAAIKQQSGRRGSDGSDGLYAEKENHSDILGRSSSSYRQIRSSPLAANTRWDLKSSPGGNFEAEGINKICSTPGSSSFQNNIRLEENSVNSVDKDRSTIGSGAEFKITHPDLLYTLEEVTASSSREEGQQMSSNEEWGISPRSSSPAVLQPIVILDESSAEATTGRHDNRNATVNWSDPRSILYPTYQSQSSSATKVSQICTGEKGVVQEFTDPFERAYKVWRGKGLMIDGNHAKKNSKRDNTKQLRSSCLNVNVSSLKTKQCSKDYTQNSDQNSFSNILDNWKSKSAKQTFSSPRSSTVIQNHHFSKQAKLKLDPLESVENYDRHPASSIPITIELSQRVSTATRSSPRSQAWKLKTARDIRIQQEKRLQRINTVNSDSGVKETYIDPVKIGGVYKSAVRKMLDDDTNKKGGINRSKSQPRGSSYHSKSTSRKSKTSTTPLRDDGAFASIMPTTNVIERNNSVRSRSHPRKFLGDSTTTRNNNCLGNVYSKHERDISMERSNQKCTFRVIDLEIDNDVNIPTEVESTIHNDTINGDSELLSPYTQRVIRNLAKVYNESDDLKTQVESDSSHPWQQDRLLHRVGSLMEESAEGYCQCSCSNSIFSGSDDLIDFFLPLMGTACLCGKTTPGLVLPDQPTSLVNILRPWQVAFLGRFGIYFGDELVKSFHRSGNALAQALQQYRKKQGMTLFPVKSCVMALQIWSKTSKTFVRSIQGQLSHATMGSIPRPNFEDDPITTLKLPNTLYILSSFMDKVPNDSGVQMSSARISKDTLRSLDPCLTSPIDLKQEKW